jgi:hypothetical protein
MPHDVDVKALMRLAIVYDIPMALNRATAERPVGAWTESAGRPNMRASPVAPKQIRPDRDQTMPTPMKPTTPSPFRS